MRNEGSLLVEPNGRFRWDLRRTFWGSFDHQSSASLLLLAALLVLFMLHALAIFRQSKLSLALRYWRFLTARSSQGSLDLHFRRLPEPSSFTGYRPSKRCRCFSRAASPHNFSASPGLERHTVA